ncbi:hypothetical protein CsSME_00049340 [Camellia sinensis var. sinensis]
MIRRLIHEPPVNLSSITIGHRIDFLVVFTPSLHFTSLHFTSISRYIYIYWYISELNRPCLRELSGSLRRKQMP